jgi:hypothetical protein
MSMQLRKISDGLLRRLRTCRMEDRHVMLRIRIP